MSTIENHVHRELRARLLVNLESTPEIPEALLQYLEVLYAPRCYTAQETIEDHLLFAGGSLLVQSLRAIQTERQGASGDDLPLSSEELEFLQQADGETTTHQT